jgi:hypothetical protein
MPMLSSRCMASTEIQSHEINKLMGVHGPGRLCRYSESLQAGRAGDQIPLTAKFSAPVQNGPGARSPSLLYNGWVLGDSRG